jgi:hypothetical protein
LVDGSNTIEDSWPSGRVPEPDAAKAGNMDRCTWIFLFADIDLLHQLTGAGLASAACTSQIHASFIYRLYSSPAH